MANLDHRSEPVYHCYGYPVNGIGYSYDDNDNQEDEQVSIAEGHDELPRGSIGEEPSAVDGLMGPAKLIIFSSQLHPN